MGGKKTVEKNREWEKERRGKLNVGFNELCKLLPDHDPSISLSKMEILKRAAAYIRLLQVQNDEIVKSGSDNELKMKAERLKKRVAYLLLKTKELVDALRAAGIPIPNSNKKKGHTPKKATTNGAINQNRIPSSDPATVPGVVLVESGGEIVSESVPDVKSNSPQCCCKKKNKTPLSEVNGTSTRVTSTATILGNNVLVSNCHGQATILNSIQTLNVEKSLLTTTLGPGTLLLRDGRLIAVPPPISIIPPILVKPQPTVIVMQRAQPTIVRKEKLPLIVPKNREITQTTFSNKAPIPAIKTFRMESYPRTPRPKKKKKEEKLENSNAEPTCSETKNFTNPGKVAAINIAAAAKTSRASSESHARSNLKRKYDTKQLKSKVSKSCFPTNEEKNSNASDSVKTTEPNIEIITKTSTNGQNEGIFNLPAKVADGDVRENVSNPLIMFEPVINKCSPNPTLHELIPAGDDDRIDNKNDITNLLTLTSEETADEHRLTNLNHSFDENEMLNNRQTNATITEYSRRQTESVYLTDLIINDKDGMSSIHTTKSETASTTTSTILDRVRSTECHINDTFTGKDPHRVSEVPTSCYGRDVQGLFKDKDLMTPIQSTPEKGLSDMDTRCTGLLGVECGNELTTSKQNFAEKETTAHCTNVEQQGSGDGVKNISMKLDYPINKTPNESLIVKTSTLIQDTGPLCGNVSILPEPNKTSTENKSLAANDSRANSDGRSINSRAQNCQIFPDGNESTRIFLFQENVLSQNMTCAQDNADHLMNSVTLVNSSNLTVEPLVNPTDPNCPPEFNLKPSVAVEGNGRSEGMSCDQDLTCRTAHLKKRSKFSKSVSKRSIGLNEANSAQLEPCDKTCQVGPSSSEMITVLNQEVVSNQTVAPSSCTKTIDAASSSTFSSSNQQSTIPPVTEHSRTDNFFNYDNPIGTLPSVDPFFTSFIGKADLPSTCTVSPVTCFSYSNLTTQAPSVRSVARQLFSVEPSGNIPNNYPVISNRQSDPDLNTLSHMPSSSSQMFQFGSFSTTNTFRETLFFPNEYTSTPNKTSVTGIASQNDKETFPDLLHPASTNSFPSITTNVAAAGTSAAAPCFPSDSICNQMTSTLPTVQCHKDFVLPDPKSSLEESQIKQNSKPYHSEANFSMDVITSRPASDLREFDHNRTGQSGVFNKPGYNETAQNWNIHYMPSSQSQLSSQATDTNYNPQMRDMISTSHNQSNINLRLAGSSNAEHTTNSVDHLGSTKLNLAKEFNMSTDVCVSSSFDQKNNQERFDGQGNVFLNNICNQFPDLPTKSQFASASATGCHSWPNLRDFGNAQQMSVNQGVQTHQSYLCKMNPQGSQTARHSPVSSGNCSGSFQSSHQSARAMNSERKLCRSLNANQEKIPANVHVKQKSNEDLNQVSLVSSQSAQTRSSYQLMSNLPKTTSKSSDNPFSSSYVFSYPGGISQNHTYSPSPMFTTYPSISSTPSHLIYSNPTTVGSNFSYVQGPNTTVGTPLQRGLNQNTMGLSAGGNKKSREVPTSTTSNMFSSLQTSLHSIHEPSDQNPITNQTKLSQSNNSFIGAPEGNPSPSNTKIRNSAISNFHMTNIANFSNQHVEGHPSNHHSAPQSSQSVSTQNCTLQGPKNAVVEKGNSVFLQTNASNTHQTSSKGYEYPLASILTGLGDAALGSSLISSGKNSGTSEANDKTPIGGEKADSKQYSQNNANNTFKNAETGCAADYLRTKESDRNPFIPIIEDVRLNSEFSNDLFNSLHVPSGGTHSDSISPTAAFLLAFPLVSNSKNAENLAESDHPENSTTTPTTILQIGNVDPPNSDLFQPLEFGKDLEPSDYLGQTSDKFKRKETVSQEKGKKHLIHAGCSQTYNYSSLPADCNAAMYDQTWNDFQNKTKPMDDGKKNEKASKDASVNFEISKQDKKKKNKISVNWMTAPDESFQKEVESSSFPALNLPFPMDIDSFPDLCSTKKNCNANSSYSWSPSKTLLPLDSGLMIPSTLPTLVGDLALGTPTPSDSFGKRVDTKKNQEKLVERRTNPQKAQNNFLSVSQLVDAKSKKQKLPENRGKKIEKKKSVSCQKRKDSSEPCMYSDNYLPSLGWDKHRYKNNYSAEALIGSQDATESVHFPYQQNANCFPHSDFTQDQQNQTQQYQNNIAFPSQYPHFGTEDYQSDSYNMPQQQNPTSKRVQLTEKRDGQCQDNLTTPLSRYNGCQTSFQHPPLPQQYLGSAPPVSSSTSTLPPNFSSNTTTSVTNFNLSTIFPEINERTGTRGQQNNQPQQLGNNMNSFSNNSSSNYRTNL